eukprot:TRINITY_DN3717_c1_g1_i3.p1 TRINITY_DN3717_c1_g1~~TRINITY_DN3717_c1_g1_i3.p1  ORF type:complete len:589 (+),score=131.72 TRINITY_DN3717_c1_g1_i3:38-1804(+)
MMVDVGNDLQRKDDQFYQTEYMDNELTYNERFEPTSQERLIQIIDETWALMDTDASGDVDEAAFARFMVESYPGTPADKIAATFQLLDTNNDGKISKFDFGYLFARQLEEDVGNESDDDTKHEEAPIAQNKYDDLVLQLKQSEMERENMLKEMKRKEKADRDLQKGKKEHKKLEQTKEKLKSDLKKMSFQFEEAKAAKDALQKEREALLKATKRLETLNSDLVEQQAQATSKLDNTNAKVLALKQSTAALQQELNNKKGFEDKLQKELEEKRLQLQANTLEAQRQQQQLYNECADAVRRLEEAQSLVISLQQDRDRSLMLKEEIPASPYKNLVEERASFESLDAELGATVFGPDGTYVSDLTDDVDRLREENARLKEQLRQNTRNVLASPLGTYLASMSPLRRSMSTGLFQTPPRQRARTSVGVTPEQPLPLAYSDSSAHTSSPARSPPSRRVLSLSAEPATLAAIVADTTPTLPPDVPVGFPTIHSTATTTTTTTTTTPTTTITITTLSRILKRRNKKKQCLSKRTRKVQISLLLLLLLPLLLLPLPRPVVLKLLRMAMIRKVKVLPVMMVMMMMTVLSMLTAGPRR